MESTSSITEKRRNRVGKMDFQGGCQICNKREPKADPREHMA